LRFESEIGILKGRRTILGMSVWVRFVDGREVTYRNVTEIHSSYPTIDGDRIAFESDVHSTGCTWERSRIAEFEAKAESEEANAF
jgi:hypothetical protein